MAGPSFGQRIASLLGISTYQPPVDELPGIPVTSKLVDRVRTALGGQLEALPVTKLHWYLPDLETAQTQADRGDMQLVGMLGQSMRRDGALRGLLDSRTSIVAKPRVFVGGATSTGKEIIEVLQSKNGSDRSVYDEMIPVNESSRLVEDGLVAGVGVGELVPVQGRDYPVLVRRLPQNAWYLWQKNQWFYRSIAGLIPITPGLVDENGHGWVLYLPGGRVTPWNYGLWPALGRAFISKEHAFYSRQNFIAKLANPARYAKVPVGASEPERKGFLEDLIAWGLNTVFELPQGWDVGLLESNGQGFEVFQADIDTCNKEFAAALLANTVMFEGGVGFDNTENFASRTELLEAMTAETWAHTVNTQILPGFIMRRWGVDALANAVGVTYQTTPIPNMKIMADTLQALGQGIAQLAQALAAQKRTLNVDALCAKFSIPLVEETPGLQEGASKDLPAAPGLKAPEVAAAPAKSNGVAGPARAAEGN